MKELIYSGELGRYRILQPLADARQSYLAEDLTHLNELFVLREISDSCQARISSKQQGAENAIFQLNHPQIPRFRELLQTEFQGKPCWFWVEDYMPGKTYRSLLQHRLRQRQPGFSELEITALLLQVLPILDYIHAKFVVHGHISPDTIVLRSDDALPILVFREIERGYTPIKTPAVPAESAYLGDMPHNDLCALAMTSLVLLSGKVPPVPHTASWDWQQELVLSPQLTRILQRMLSQKPEKRFSSATEVIQALRKALPPAHFPMTRPQRLPKTAQPVPTTRGSVTGCVGKAVLAMAVIVGPGIGGWFAGKAWLKQQATTAITETVLQQPQPSPSQPPEPLFQQRQQQVSLERRRRTLDIKTDFFDELTDWAFDQRYPSQRGTLAPQAGRKRQQRRNEIAAEYLEQLAFLSAEARQRLGSYDRTTSDRLTRAVNQLHLSSRALYDLVDAEFFQRFPDQEPPLAQPLTQIWQAIALDKLNALRSGDALEQIEPDDSIIRRRGTLAPGEGQAYTIYLEADQIMEVDLLAGQDALFSIYSPSGQVNMLEDTTARQWSGVLPESGYYEFTIVSQAEQSFSYRLTLAFDPPQEEELSVE